MVYKSQLMSHLQRSLHNRKACACSTTPSNQLATDARRPAWHTPLAKRCPAKLPKP